MISAIRMEKRRARGFSDPPKAERLAHKLRGPVVVAGIEIEMRDLVRPIGLRRVGAVVHLAAARDCEIAPLRVLEAETVAAARRVPVMWRVWFRATSLHLRVQGVNGVAVGRIEHNAPDRRTARRMQAEDMMMRAGAAEIAFRAR